MNDHLPEIVFFCAVISAFWDFVKGYDALSVSDAGRSLWERQLRNRQQHLRAIFTLRAQDIVF